MYSDRDVLEINGRLRRAWLALGIAAAALLAALVIGLAGRVQWLVYAAAALLFLAAAFGIGFYIAPMERYRRFLEEMGQGLRHGMTGSVVSIASEPETQDGARVLPVRILLAEEQDERIVYLNASKAGLFPAVGETARLKLYGRHVVEVE